MARTSLSLSRVVFRENKTVRSKKMPDQPLGQIRVIIHAVINIGPAIVKNFASHYFETRRRKSADIHAARKY